MREYKTANEDLLPAGWRLVRLREVSKIIAGQSPPSSTYQNSPDGLPFFQGKADFGSLYPVARVWCTQPTKIALAGDILISVRAPVGPTNLADVECCIGRGLAAIRCGKEIDRDFVLAALRRFESELIKRGSGSTFDAISRSDLENFEFPLPPLAEQKRIAAALNERMAAVERARVAAQAQLDDAKALPAAYFRQIFPQPGQGLPIGWRWVKLGRLIAEALPGFAIGERDPKGVIQLRMNNVNTQGHIIWDKFIRVPAANETIDKFRLSPGDVVFNNTNSTELVGKSAVFFGHVEPIVYSNHFTRLRTKMGELDSRYFASWLFHQWQLRIFENLCNRWIGQSAVKSDMLLALEFPLPLLAEQKRFAAELSQRLAVVGKVRLGIEEQLNEINELPVALLRKAFNGEL